MNNQQLIELALHARQKAYCPYSGFAVGAALLCSDGSVYTGCNIENSSFSPTNCAERTGFFKAVSEGKRDFISIAVVGGNADNDLPTSICPPRGVCRQVMREFCSADFEVIMAKNAENYKVMTLSELLPESFDKREVN